MTRCQKVSGGGMGPPDEAFRTLTWAMLPGLERPSRSGPDTRLTAWGGGGGGCNAIPTWNGQMVWGAMHV